MQDDVVGVEDRAPVERDAVHPGGLRAGRDHDLLAAHGLPVDLERVLVPEAGAPVEERDAVPQQLVADDRPLLLDDVAGARGEVRDRDLVLQAVVLPVDRALPDPGEVDDRLPDRLRRDRPDVDAAPADDLAPLDERDLLPQLGRLNRSLLPSGPAANHEELVVEAHPSTLASPESAVKHS